jgi:hypothetical protein
VLAARRLPPRACRQPLVQRLHLGVMPLPLLMVGFLVEVVQDRGGGADGSQDQRTQLQTQVKADRSDADWIHHCSPKQVDWPCHSSMPSLRDQPAEE